MLIVRERSIGRFLYSNRCDVSIDPSIKNQWIYVISKIISKLSVVVIGSMSPQLCWYDHCTTRLIIHSPCLFRKFHLTNVLQGGRVRAGHVRHTKKPCYSQLIGYLPSTLLVVELIGRSFVKQIDSVSLRITLTMTCAFYIPTTSWSHRRCK